MNLQIDDSNRVRTLTLNRPDALNAFNEALYDEVTDALLAAGGDPEVSVVLLTAPDGHSRRATTWSRCRHGSPTRISHRGSTGSTA